MSDSSTEAQIQETTPRIDLEALADSIQEIFNGDLTLLKREYRDTRNILAAIQALRLAQEAGQPSPIWAEEAWSANLTQLLGLSESDLCRPEKVSVALGLRKKGQGTELSKRRTYMRDLGLGEIIEQARNDPDCDQKITEVYEDICRRLDQRLDHSSIKKVFKRYLGSDFDILR